MDAHLTNAITNGLHALCLLGYFLASKRAANLGNPNFTTAVVGFFLLTFLLKILGVFVHYDPVGAGVAEAWAGIAAGMVALSYMILFALGFPPSRVALGFFFALTSSALFLVKQDFLFLAVQIVVINGAAALHCHGLLRIGFLGVGISTVVWIVARKGTEMLLGGEVPTAYRYDNDLFHFMLIASTFIIYKAFARGSGLPETFGREPLLDDGERAPGG